MTIYASIAHMTEFLFTAHGEAVARHHFGNEAVDALPKFGPRSKHNGKPKGVINYRKVTRGGWIRLEGRV